MILQVMPQFFCNLKCGYCYLGDLTNDKTCLSFERFCEMYKELVCAGYTVEGIEVFGGSLETPEADRFIKKLVAYKPETNVMGSLAFGSNSVSFNIERGDALKALQYINMRKHCNVYTVVLPTTALLGPDWYYKQLEKEDFRGIVNFIQYIPAENSKLKFEVKNRDYSKFMIKAIKSYYKKQRGFKLDIIDLLEDALHGHYDPRMTSHIFISPQGKYGYVSYNQDNSNLEKFIWCDTLQEWEAGATKEKLMRPLKCAFCENNSCCIAEHLRHWGPKDDCCGFNDLIKWWKTNRGKYGFDN